MQHRQPTSPFQHLAAAARALSVFLLLGGSLWPTEAAAAIKTYWATLAPEVQGATGTGTVAVTVDTTLNTMRVQATFSGLSGNTTTAHIHSATETPETGATAVATQSAGFTGLPPFVKAGSMDQTLNLTLSSSWSAAFINANGATTASATTALITGMDQRRAYFSLKTSTFGSGEIRGFLIPTIVVTTANDSTPGTATDTDGVTSLREAIALAQQSGVAQVIRFNGDPALGAPLTGTNVVNFYDGTARTIQLAQGQLGVSSNVTIVGPGADRVTVRGDWNGSTTAPTGSRVFNITGGATVEISGLTVENGAAVGGEGGGISNFGNTLTLRRCVIRGCFSQLGGGGVRSQDASGRPGVLRAIECAVIGNSGAWGGGLSCVRASGLSTLLVSHSLVAQNTARSATSGGGIFCDGQTSSTIVGSTIVGNTTAAPSGGGISGSNNVAIAIQNTLVAGNTGSSGASDLSGGTVTDKGGNLIGLPNGTTLGQVLQVDGNGNPLLANNGGPTPTVALVAGSPAIDAGVNLTTLTTALTDDTTTSLTLGDTSGLTVGGTIQIDAEQMTVVTIPTATTCTVTRGANGSSASTHAANAPVNYPTDQRGSGFARVGLGKVGGSPLPDIGATEFSPGTVIYWTNGNAGTIGRANLDGTGVNQSFITTGVSVAGLAVDGTYVYWSTSAGNIGRARLDGTASQPSFITGNSSLVFGLAVNGTHLFWADAAGAIARANLDGTGVNRSFITAVNRPRNIALNGSYIYWTNSDGTTIGRANLNGSNATQNFANVPDSLTGIAVDSDYIYWTRSGGGLGTTLGRVSLDGTTGWNDSFITGANAPRGMAVTATNLFWTNSNSSTVGRANLDGSGVNQAFIPTANAAISVVVAPGFLTPVVTSRTTTLAGNATTLTITGANFDPNPANNTVVLSNGAVGTVTAATATTLTVTFSTPPTSSGALTAVVTTNGVSSGAAVQVGGVADSGSLVVTTLVDSVPDTPTDYDGQTSLREAIAYANTLNARADITFNIAGGGTIALAAQNAAGARMLPILTNPNGITIDGANGGQGAIVIDGGSTSDTTGDRVFFIGVGAGEAAAATGFGSLVATTNTAWAIRNLTIRNGNARGGNGGDGGGGAGAGMGGAIFVNAGSLSLSSVAFTGNRAVGGLGGAFVNSGFSGGGGGMGGHGGGGNANGGGGGGGFGIGADGGTGGVAVNGQPGLFAGAAGGGTASSGGATGGSAGGAGGSGIPVTAPLGRGAGGGGGVKGANTSNDFTAGPGGFGGGAGGSGAQAPAVGGFGGGGSGGRAGGFGGGGGASFNGSTGAGGFGGGNGSRATGGGGGAALGGAIFVRQGASATISGGSMAGGSVTGGTGGNPGQGIGSGVFLAGSATWDVSTGQTVTLADTLGGGVDAQITGGFTKTGAGTLVLAATGNSHTGGTNVNGGTLRVTGSFSAAGSTTTVASGATLEGTGTLAGPVTVQSGGTLGGGQPTATGILRPAAVTFSSGSTLRVRLNGTTPGTDYDQLQATGDVALGGATLSVAGSITPGAGSTFPLIQTTGALSGTFQNLPDGALLTVGPTTYRVIYTANAVTLSTFANLTRLQTDASFDLFTVTGQPTGSGTFSGPGVTNNSFDPNAAGLGEKTITFTPTTGSPVTFTITVTETPSLVVTTTGDTTSNVDGQTTLREAIAYANTLSVPATITFDPTVFATPQTIALTNGTLTLSGDVTITGTGARRLALAGNNSFTILSVAPGARAVVSGVTITGGAGGNAAGGGVTNQGTLDLVACAVTGNTNIDGSAGAIFNSVGSVLVRECLISNNTVSAGSGGYSVLANFFGVVRIIDSTISGNQVLSTSPNAGTIVSTSSGVLTILNSTITGNSTAGAGQTIFIGSGPGTLGNTIVAGNTGAAGFTDTSGAFISSGGNLIGNVGTASGFTHGVNGDQVGTSGSPLDPQLAPLADNGGPTDTQAPLANSRVIDAGVAQTISETQWVQVRGGAGTFTLSFGGQTTAPLASNASGIPTVQNALAGLSSIGAGNVIVNGSASSYYVTFTGALANANQAALVATGSGGATVTVTTLQEGGPSTRATDQRGSGFPRLRSAAVEIGAYEVQPPTTLFVNRAVSGGTGRGDSWANAMPELRTALAVAQTDLNMTQIWVARGTYRPAASGGDRNATFQLRNGLAIYGGFSGAGTETQLAQRNADAATNGTVLSGDLNGNDSGAAVTNNATRAENSYHVVTGSGTDGTAVLDGFRLTAGNANGVGGGEIGLGGGLYSDSGSPSVRNITFSGNSAAFGGGIFNQSSSPMLASVTFSGNSASSEGGGIYNQSSSPMLTNVTFSGNSATRGGGIYNASSSNPTLTNVTFSGNSATNGGGIYNGFFTNPTLINVTFSGNSATNGGGIYNDGSNPTLRNCILWGDSGLEISENSGSSTTVRNSIVQGSGDATNGNVVLTGGQTPQFVTPIDLQATPAPTTAGNLRLRAGSPAIGVGDPAALPNGVTTDLDGNPRVNGAGVDLGAYEFTAPTFNTNSFTVTVGGADVDLTTAQPSPGGGTFSYLGTPLANGRFTPTTMGVYAITYTSPLGYTATVTITVTEAPSLVVTTTSDSSTNIDGRTSLREALAYAQQLGGTQTILFNGDPTLGTPLTGGGVVNFYGSTAQTITLGGTELAITTGDVTITGPGANRLSVSGNNASRVLRIASGATGRLSGLTVTGGNGVSSVDSGWGGGLENAGTLVLEGCAVSGNTAGNSAGGIRNNGGTLEVSNSLISGNSSGNGGGILVSGGTVRLRNTTISGNAVTSGGPGAIAINGGSVSLTNATVTANTATALVGGISFGAGSLTLANTLIAGNLLNGAASDLAGAPVTSLGSNLIGASSATINGTTTGNQIGVNPRLGPLADNGGPTRTHALLPGSPAIDAGSNALAVDGNNQPLTTDQRGVARARRGQPSAATAVVDIGAYEATVPRLYVNQSVPNGGNGSGDSWANAMPELRTALAAAQREPSIGEIWVARGTYRPAAQNSGDRNATFRLRNGLEIYGGFTAGQANLTDREANPASNGTVLSGDLSVNDSGALVFNNSTRADNSYQVVTGSGTDGTAVLDGFTVTAGNANGPGQQRTGGGLYSFLGSPSLRNLTFSGNSAFQDGGGIYNLQSSSPTLTNVTISGNSSLFGSGGGIYNDRSSPTLTNVTISGNSASSGSGGGIYNASSNPTLTNVTISGNSASYGGGIYNTGGSSPTLTNVTISGNSALEGGGVSNIDSNPTLTNVTISGNSASGSGGGIYNFRSSNPTLTNVTISGNSASTGGGIYNLGSSSPTLRNCILWGDSGGEISENSGSSTTVRNSIVQGSGDATNGNVVLTGGQTPQFVTPIDLQATPAPTTAGNLRLRAGSPAIGVGDPAALPNGVTTDLDGNPRVNGAGVDLGAYEFTAPTFAQSSLTATVGGADVDLTTAQPSPGGGTFSYLGTPLANGRFTPTTMGVYAITYTSPLGYTATVTITVTEAPSLVVTTDQDSTPGTATDMDGRTSLREALAYAQTLSGPQTITFSNTPANGAVNFHDGTAQTITLGGTELQVTGPRNITIAGPGADRLTLSGGERSRVFAILGSDTIFTLRTLTVANGLAPVQAESFGGGIYSLGTLTLERCVIRDNRTSATDVGIGAGVYATGPTTILQSSFLKNTSASSGRQARAGGLYVSGMTSIAQTLFSGNVATLSGAVGAAAGGGFYAIGRANLVQCLLTENVAVSTGLANATGGAFAAESTARIKLINSTVSGNEARCEDVASGISYGGGIRVQGNGEVLELINSTVTANRVSGPPAGGLAGGGGISGNVTAQNTIVAGNTSALASQNLQGNVVSRGGNLIFVPGSTTTFSGDTTGNLTNVDPRLSPLLDNGGPTRTHALLPGSPAIDAGSDALAVDENNQPLTTDQRGVARARRGLVASANAISDIGAYEAAPARLYVNQSVPNGGNGSGDSWTNAMAELRTAMALAQADPNVTEIWVARGTYRPAAQNSGDRNATFQLRNGLAIYGGFTAGQANLSDREANPASNETVLSGDLNGNDTGSTNNGENSYHVVIASGTDATAVLDGFTVTAGNANGVGFLQTLGGGLYSVSGSPSLRNLTFSGNSAANGGGGIYNNTSSSPTLTNVTFSGNSAPTSNGGGIFNSDSSSPRLTNVIFSGNSAQFGGGMVNDKKSSPTLTNVTFSGNSATNGGGILNNGSSPTLTNVTISGNSAGNLGDGICNLGGSTQTLRNCILWGNAGDQIFQSGNSTTTVSNSIVQGSTDTSNGNLVPADQSANGIRFIAPVDLGATPPFYGNLRLQPGSPAVNAGNGSVTNPSLPATDLDGALRVIGVAVDLGAYELIAPPTLTQTDLRIATGGSLTDLAALTGAAPGGGVFTGNGVSVDGNGRYVFTSGNLPVGTPVTVTYTIPGPNGTSNQTTFTITVTETPSLVVTTTSDSSTNIDGRTSLREALAYAQTLSGPQTITFSNTPANGAVNFHDGTAQTITLGGTELQVTGPRHITIAGPGADRLTISGNQASRVFNFGANVVATLHGVKVMNGKNTTRIEAFGGGIFNAGTLRVESCVISENTAVATTTSAAGETRGAGIYSRGPLTIIDSAVERNTATYPQNSGSTVYNVRGGGIYCEADLQLVGTTIADNEASTAGSNGDAGGGGVYFVGGRLTAVNSTIVGNTALGPGSIGSGGGVLVFDGAGTFTHCTISGNSAFRGGGVALGASVLPTGVRFRSCVIAGNISTAPANVSAYTPEVSPHSTSLGFNLVGDSANTSGWVATDILDPVGGAKLGALASNGGPVPTAALLPGSPAIDAGAALATLGAAVPENTTTLSVADARLFPGGVGLVVQVGSEQMLVLSADTNANTLTVQRGANGTTAAAHSAGAGVNYATDQRGSGFARVVRGKAATVGAVADIGAYERMPFPAVTPIFANGVAANGIDVGTNDGPFDLAGPTVGALPAGGTFTGTGTGGTNGATFTPTTLVPGDYPITYTTVPNVDGFTASAGFTIRVFDNTPPTLTAVGIASNNANATQARVGDVVTLSFTASEAIGTPQVTIAGRSATVNGSGANWTAAITVQVADAEVVVPFSIGFTDLAGNAGTAVMATTNGSAVTIDTTAPTVQIGGPMPAQVSTGPVSWTVTYTGADAVTLGATDVTVNSTGTAAAGSVEVTGAGSDWTVTLSNLTGNGTLSISLNAGTARDTAGNLAGAAGPSATVRVDNVPTIVSVTPGVVLQNTGATLAVVGTNFVSGSQTVTFTPAGGVATTLTPSNVTPSSMTVTLPANLLSVTGTGELKVTTAGGSAPANVEVVAPAITQLSPASVNFGAGDTVVTVTGANFVVAGTSATTVRWTPSGGGAASDLAARSVTGTSLQFTVPAALLAQTGSAQVQVLAGEAESAGATFAILGNEPTLSGVEPAAVRTGPGTVVLTLQGTELRPGAQTLRYTAPGGAPVEVAITQSTATQLTATLPAGSLATAGEGRLSLTTGGGTAVVPVMIVNPAEDDVAFTAGRRAVPIEVLANDLPLPPGSAGAVLTVVSAPGSGSAVVDGRRIVYTPQAALPLAGDTFRYRYEDGAGGVGEATVRVKSLLGVAGDYDGLITPTEKLSREERQTRTGYLQVWVNRNGAMTGALALGGRALNSPSGTSGFGLRRFALRGSLNQPGGLVRTIARAPEAPVTLTLRYDEESEGLIARVESQDAGGAFVVESVLQPRRAAGTREGIYTLRVEPPAGANTPTGSGFAQVRIGRLGHVRTVGELADGTKFSTATYLQAEQRFAIYAGLYARGTSARGRLSGVLEFPSRPLLVGEARGVLDWRKPERPGDALFAAGFDESVTTLLTRYVRPGRSGGSVLDLGGTSPNGQLVLSAGAGLNVAVDFTLSEPARVTLAAGAPAGVTLRFVVSTGQFTGSFRDPATGATVIFSGNVQQPTQSGAGYFAQPKTGLSGAVEISRK